MNKPILLTGATSAGHSYIDALRAILKGRAISPPAVAQDQPESIRQAVQTAYDRRGALTIEYFSPHSGEMTMRTIEPVMLYERGGAQYVEAWCRLEDATRTFRIDRIIRVLPEDTPAKRQREKQ